MTEIGTEIMRSFCNCCMQQTEHDVIHTEVSEIECPDGSALMFKTFHLMCRGCKDASIRKEHWYFDYIPEPDRDPSENLIKTIFMPPRTWQRPPNWLSELETIDPDLKGLLDEVYSVTNDQQIRLLSIGVRTALDHVMIKILGRDVGIFEKKLDKMVRDGHLTEGQKENLSVVIDAGSASTHRGYKLPRQLIEEMLSVMENIVRQHYITGPMLKHAKTKIPSRPK